MAITNDTMDDSIHSGGHKMPPNMSLLATQGGAALAYTGAKIVRTLQSSRMRQVILVRDAHEYIAL